MPFAIVDFRRFDAFKYAFICYDWYKATALWIAVHKTFNSPLVWFLLRKGGEFSPAREEQEPKLLIKARKIVELERVLLIGHFKKAGGENDSSLSSLPLTLFKRIYKESISY